MKISFYGAAGEVTGSCSLLENTKVKILVDCGMFQGGDFVEERNGDPFVFDTRHLNAVIITHAHLDHIGRLPLLIKAGYQGFIYATPPTADLMKLVLEDALEVMTYNHKKYGSPILYAENDVTRVISQIKKTKYGEKTFLVDKETSFVFHDAGHIFGSAFVELESNGKRVIFSGDLGNVNVPILKDTEALPKNVDLLVCESTYGNRLHDKRFDRRELIKKVIKESIARGGVLMMPAFSVERTQEILYDLNEMIDRDQSLPFDIPIFLDSPLAIDATEVFNHHTECFDEEARDFLLSGDELFEFEGLRICRTREESKKINSVPGQKVIIAGAGMMNGGRIQHHALRYLSDSRNTLFFTGFQAAHTLGRRILDGEKFVHIFNEKVAVKCKVEYYDVLSAHADEAKLFDWIKNNGQTPKKVCLNHGEVEQSKPLAQRLENELGLETYIADPYLAVAV